MDANEKRIRQRLRDDYPHYAEKVERIRSETGELLPFKLWAGQLLLNAAAEKQLEDRGLVRMLVPKARRHGVSAFVEGRGYWKATHNEGYRVFILTHRDQSTNELFKMVKTFYDLTPDIVKPSTERANANELVFGKLKSSYGVGTAKGKDIGRGDGLQFLHLSEHAYFANPEEHTAGILQAVSGVEGTEIWSESTGNGAKGPFYRMCNAALEGRGEYGMMFLPWMISERYILEPPLDWVPPEQWEKYGKLHKLTPQQLYWAYKKNEEFAIALEYPSTEPCFKFRVEYPAVYQEVFISQAGDPVVKLDWILSAERSEMLPDKKLPMVLGVDTSAGEEDASWIVSRRGNVGGEVMIRTMTKDEMELAGIISDVMSEHRVAGVYIDITGGYGRGVRARLNERGFHNVHGVNFGSTKCGNEFRFKKDEIWWRMREWFQGDVRIVHHPGDILEQFREHLTVVGWHLNSSEKKVIDDKRKIRSEHHLSPDAGDAFALTFTQLMNWSGMRGNYSSPIPTIPLTPQPTEVYDPHVGM